MENFVLIGKAKTVFQIIELMAKGEKAVKAQKTEGKVMRKKQKTEGKVMRKNTINKSRSILPNTPYFN